jgi:hypothetical protein
VLGPLFTGRLSPNGGVANVIHFFTSAYDVAVPILGVLTILVAALANACINVNTFSLQVRIGCGW